ncbi:helix-turn-helix domain-containing protein [Alkalicoccus chagannorensis]|uniref:helix-turn-helix domain-containing protein n=1 Tax=Alkalicoccus chagannorensis TaxID=427072 RepID=UPI00040D1FFB|nr:GAF domain-containing protein [Alkalicoccus chagannorensis]
MEQHQKLLSLIGAARALTSSLDLETVLLQLTGEVSRVIDGVHGILLFLYDEEHQLLRIRMTGGYFQLDAMRQTVLVPGEGISGSVFASGTGRILHTAAEAEATMANIRKETAAEYSEALGGYHIPTSVLSVPMMARGKAIGVLTVDAFDDSITFTEEDLDVLETFAAQASIAIENAMLFARQQRTQMIHEALSNVALARGGTRDITRTLAGLIEEKVVLVNDVFDLLEASSAGAREEALSLLEAQKDRLIQEVQHSGPSILHWQMPAGGRRAVFFPVRSEGTTLGWLAVIMKENSRIDPLDRFAIEQTSVVFAGEMLRRKKDIIETATARGQLLKPLLDHEWEELSYMQISSLPYHHAGEADYVLAHMTLPQGQWEEAEHPLLRYLTRELLQDEEHTYLLHRGQEMTIMFTLTTPEERQSMAIVRRRIEEYAAQVERYTGFRPAAGLGRSVPQLKYVRASYRDALKCAEAARTSGTLLSPADLGPERLFMSMEHSELEGYVIEKLEPILQCEPERRSVLLASLEAYVNENQSLRAASDTLFIHVNTLKYRLNSIRQLLQLEEFNGKILFELQLALYIQRYLERTNR